MASGKKNYFRHSFNAHNDIKLRVLRDEIGVGFYFYYFSLLELCGNEAADEKRDSFIFHDSIIRSLWGVNLKKSERVARVMDAVGLLLFKKGDKTFQFTIPNLSKYMGKYTTKLPSNTPNKRKGKEIKEKERKENTGNDFTLSFDSVSQMFHDICVGQGDIKPASFSGSKLTIDNFLILSGFPYFQTKENWVDYFNKVKDSNFLKGKNERGFTATLPWLVKPEIAEKVLAGQYDNKTTQTGDYF